MHSKKAILNYGVSALKQEKSVVKLYKVNKSGLYKPFQRSKTAAIGSLSELMEDIYSWYQSSTNGVDGMCTFTCDEDSTFEHLESYLISCKKTESGDFFLTFWNRTHATGSDMYALDPRVNVKSLSATNFTKGKIPKNSIPGNAAYFWVIPSKNIVATIRIGRLQNGIAQMKTWMDGFIHGFSKWVEKEFNGNGFDIKGYKDSKGNIREDLESRFECSPFQAVSKIDAIKANREHITGIVHSTNLIRTTKLNDTLFGNVLRKLRLKKDNYIDGEVELKYHIKITPTEEDLEKLIKFYTREKNLTSTKRIGFSFSTNNGLGLDQTEWLKSSIVHESLNISLEWLIVGQLVDLDLLSKELINIRSVLLERAVENVK